MLDWEIKQYISCAKEGNEDATNYIIQKLKPLLWKYVRKLYFMERDDAYQELVLSLIEAIHKIQIISSDFSCLRYLEISIQNKYNNLCKKHIMLSQRKTVSDDCLAYVSASENSIENYIDLQYIKDLLQILSPQEKRIMKKLILLGYSEADIAKELQVTRQYIYKVKKKSILKWKSLLKYKEK